MKLRDVAFALPAQRVDAATIAEWTGGDERFIREKIGIASRNFLAPGETGVGLAAEACTALFSRRPELSPGDIGLLIVVTQNPDYRLPHNSALLQDRLGLPVNTACFDIGLGCSGYVYALSIVKALMAAEEIDEALLVTVDTYSSVMGRGDRDTVSVFGDAATASWLSAKNGAKIGRADFGTDGANAEHLIIRQGGTAAPLFGMNATEDEIDTDSADNRLHMNGRAIFNFMMERAPGSVKRCLDRNGLGVGDIDMFVFHQASRFMLETLVRKAGLEAGKVPIEIEETGNTVSSSIPLVLSRRMEDGSLAGKTALVSGFGVGLSWASNILRFPA